MVFRELVAFGNRIVSVTLLPFRLEVRNKVRDVQAMLRLCNSLLKDLDGRKNKEDRENELEIHIRDVVCRLEDVLDIFFFRYNSRRVEKYRGTFIDKVKAMREIMFKGRKIETMMSNITKERRKERIYTHVDEESVVGMEVDTQNLTLQIVDDVHQVICLYGIAGIGKTTMARRLYNHHIVRDHFEGFAWISTNSNIARTDVIGIILEKLDPEGYNLSMNIPDAELATKLHQLLQKKKCLLVLDDLTSKDIWKFLHRAFPSGETSSKILVTTRERTVAAHVAGDDRGIIHLMKSLNQQESWQLFRQGAFTGNHAEFSSSYNTLPYQLKSCIAHLSLFLENTRIDVEHLYLLWMAEGTISRDSEINTNMMGVAERYFSELVQRNVVQVREEEAPNWRKYSSFCVHNTIHQLCFSKGKEHFFEFLDLSCETRSTSNSSSSCSSSNPTRRLALYLRNQDTGYAAVPFTNEISKHLRCLLLVNRDDLQIKLEWPRGLPDLAKFRILRVLNFERFEFQGRKLLRGISKLFRLRYLSFKGCILEELPSSIGNLSLLWFLDLRVSSKMKIPNVLYKMEELKNLYLPLLFQTSTNDKLCLGKLKKLEVLENFNTGVCNVADLLEMKNLRNLSVTVEGNLEDLELVVQRMNASRHVLPWRGRLLYPLVMVNKFDCYTEERHLVFKKLLDSQFLRTLHMDGHLGYIPSNSKINSGLTEIVLKGSQLKEDPMTTLSEFPELQVLVLQDNAFVGKEMNCSASGFQELKRLEFSNLCFLETWEVEGESMPKLSTLTVKNCRKLQMLPNGLRLRVSSVTFENDN